MQPQLATKPWIKAKITLSQSTGQLPSIFDALKITEAIRITSHDDLVYEIEVDPTRMVNFTRMTSAFLVSENAEIIWHH